jgi:hypothetical protein
MTPIEGIYPHPASTQQETNVNTNQDMTNSEGAIALQKQFDEALSYNRPRPSGGSKGSRNRISSCCGRGRSPGRRVSTEPGP